MTSLLPIPFGSGIFFLAGLLLGRFVFAWSEWLALRAQDGPRVSATASGDSSIRRLTSWIVARRWSPPSTHDGTGGSLGAVSVSLGTAVLFSTFYMAYVYGHCQRTPAVTPDPLWHDVRVLTHLTLIALLVAATVTDLLDCIVPDAITLPGMVLAVTTATLSGDLQVVHLWVDWNQAIPDLAGPYIPEWIRQHRHWHGLAWSLTGLAVGGGMMWLVRLVSSWVLDRPTLGFGDVTLMAMIGSFLGWQPVVIVFLLAPFCGLFVGAAVKLLSNRPFVPYGPYLSAAALVVMMGWRWIWMWEPAGTFAVRKVFGDALTLALLGGVSVLTLTVLLGLLRLYRAIPVSRRTRPQ